MVDSVLVRFKNVSVSKEVPLNIIAYSGMREPVACRSASAKNAPACWGLRVGPSKPVKIGRRPPDYSSNLCPPKTFAI